MRTNSAAVDAGSADLDSFHVVIDSPIDPLTLVSTGEALSGLYLHEHGHTARSGWGERVTLDGPGTPGVLMRAATQLAAYFAGELTEFELPLALEGTQFQQRVWAELVTIPYGETASYGELAARLGNAGASRAVGLANGRNPISIVVPCHRVVGSNGQLTGYGGGIERKRALLALEERGCGISLW